MRHVSAEIAIDVIYDCLVCASLLTIGTDKAKERDFDYKIWNIAFGQKNPFQAFLCVWFFRICLSSKSGVEKFKCCMFVVVNQLWVDLICVARKECNNLVFCL